jgi:hypothetical protein
VAAIDSFGTLICHWSDSAVFEVPAGAPPVDPDATMVTASLEEIPADGTSVSLITVTPCDASSAHSGPGLLVTLETTAGVLLGSVVDQGDGTYTQQLQNSFDVATAQVSAIAGGVAITQQAVVAFAGIPAMIITGPGPGAVFGPQIRVFDDTGDPSALNSFMAHGTMRWGAKVITGDLDGDGIDEIITGPGPGPEGAEAYTARVLGWNYDGVTLEAIPGLDILAYDQSILRGARVATGPIDTDRAAAPPATDKEQQEKTAAESIVAGLVIK